MEKKWTLKGFSEIAKGTFENAGQNLYVSREKGVLQRIWQFDVNKDGYVDLLIANSHDYNEHPDTYIIHDPAGEAVCQKVLTQDAQTGAVADLNGDGCDDLIIASTHDGHHIDLPSYVYFGGGDGITENRKIDLAAKACACCGVGDFDGDGKKEICYLIADGIDASSPIGLHNIRLRVYRQEDTGFRMDDFRDYPTEVSFFTVGDVDGDGCDDLYCRTDDGKWLILWGGKDGFSMANSTEVGAATDDKTRFNLLPFGGGNVIYNEIARPKVLHFNGKIYVFYAEKDRARLIPFAGRKPAEGEICIELPNLVSVAVGAVTAPGSRDLVLLQLDTLENQRALILSESSGYQTVVCTMPLFTPRDVLLCDFTGNGHDDIVIVQGRTMDAYTSESLLYLTGEDGTVQAEPRRFTTHNCVDAFAGDFYGNGKKALVFINQQESNAYGHIPVYVYLNSENGFSPENRLEFPGHSAGTMMPIDFNDDGWPEILVMHNGEDQPHKRLPGDMYLGGPDGFDESRKITVPTPLAWGGHCADLNKDGYLDIITCGGGVIKILWGGPDGYSDDNATVLRPRERESDGRGSTCLWPAVADLNGDGWLDIVAPLCWLPYSRIYWGGPEGYSNERSTLIPVDYALTVRVADLNKDGYPDLVFGSRASYYRNHYHEGAVTIFWGGPQGYTGYNCCVLPSYQSNNITIADLNGNGWLDIFASSYFNKRERDINSFIYWNDEGHFSLTNRKRLFTHSSSAAWAGDFNEDGYVDLCITNHRAYGSHRTDSAIWWNGPKGFTEDNRTWLPTIGPHDMVPNDMGNVMTRGPEEFYIASAAQVESFRCVGWVAEIPAKTWVNCQIRTAASAEELEKAPFIGEDGTENSRFACGQTVPAELIHGKYVQVKLYLGAVNSGSTPRITEIYLA